jgi:hypothetical protein
MNIFVLDKNPIKIPQHYCDIHLRKMIVGYTQLLCTAAQMASDSAIEGFYKITHVNRPCSKWVRGSRANYGWLWELLFYCHTEYELRFKKEHASKRLLMRLGNFLISDCPLPDRFMSVWPQVMPDEFKRSIKYTNSILMIEQAITIKAYRRYYAYKLKDFRKRGICKFTKPL